MPDRAAAVTALGRLDRNSRVKFNMSDVVRGGNVCYAYCAIWILRYNIYHAESVSARIAALKTAAARDRAAEAQRAYTLAAHARSRRYVSGEIAIMNEAETGAMAETLTRFSLAFDGEAPTRTHDLVNQIEAQMNVVGRYSVIGLSENRIAGKGHAICTYRSHMGLSTAVTCTSSIRTGGSGSSVPVRPRYGRSSRPCATFTPRSARARSSTRPGSGRSGSPGRH